MRAALSSLSLRARLIGLTVLVLLLLIGEAVLGFSALQRQEEAAAWTAHTELVIALAGEAQVGITEMHAGFRGYLLTGRDQYLDPYNTGQVLYQDRLHTLEALTADNPPQVARWQDVDRRALAWQQSVASPGIGLRQDVNAGQRPLQAVADYVGGGTDEAQFTAMQQVLQDAGDTERLLLGERQNLQRQARAGAVAALISGSVVAVLVGGVGMLLVAADLIAALGALLAVSRRLARGDMAARSRMRRNDEVGAAGRALDEIAARLQQTLDDLAERTALVDLARDAILVRDGATGTIRSWSRGAQRLYGWTSEEAVGQVSHDLLQTVYSVRLADLEEQLLRTGTWSGPLLQTTRDGTQVAVKSRWVVQRDAHGKPLNYVEVHTDVTDLMKAEQRLRALQDEEAQRAADEWSTERQRHLQAPRVASEPEVPTPPASQWAPPRAAPATPPRQEESISAYLDRLRRPGSA